MRKRALICVCCFLVALCMAGGEAHADSSASAPRNAALTGGKAGALAPMVYADGVEAGPGSGFSIPVKIWGNTGIMGFKITVSYDVAALTVVNVSNGELTSDGLLDNSLGQKPGSFDVVWSGSDEIRNDGSVFTLSVNAVDSFAGTTALHLSYEQDSTFDSEFNDVEITCKDISITCTEGGVRQEIDGDPVSEYLASEISGEVSSQIDGSSIVATVDQALAEEGASSVSDISGGKAKTILDKLVQAARDSGFDTTQVDALLARAQEVIDVDPNADTASIYGDVIEGLYGLAAEDTDGGSIIVSEALNRVDDDASGDSGEVPERTDGALKDKGTSGVVAASAVIMLVVFAMVASMLVLKRGRRRRDR